MYVGDQGLAACLHWLLQPHDFLMAMHGDKHDPGRIYKNDAASGAQNGITQQAHVHDPGVMLQSYMNWHQNIAADAIATVAQCMSGSLVC